MLTAQRRRLLNALGVALVAQAALFVPLAFPLGDWLRVAALLIWAVLIPGHLLVEVVGRDFGAPATKLEWGIYALGAGYALLLALLLILSYLPGPLPGWYLHVGVDLLLLALLVAAWPVAGEDAPPQTPLPRWEVAALLLLLGLAAALRLTNIGYAEFHGDEARAVLRAAAVIQGYDDVLFLHKKGPGEILIPTAIFAALGNLTETTARLPFAVANLGALATIFWLGRRLLGPVGGLAAMLLLAVDGFTIAFARLVQYQSVVMLMSSLTLLVLVRLWQEPRALWRGLLLAALFLAAGLWAHYEAGLAALPALFAIGYLWRRYPEKRRSLVTGLAGALALGAVLLALFYVPFILNEQFSATYTYLVDRRIAGEGLPVNNVADLWIRLTTYSSSYYAIVMIGLLLGALLALYRRALGRWRALLAGGALLLVVALTVATPAWATVGSRDWWVLAAGLALIPAWFLPRTQPEERLLWIWYGVLLVLMLGFTSKPRTHVYVFFAPWALLVGMVVQRIAAWWAARPNARPRALAWAGATVGLIAVLIFGGYVYQMFAYTRVEILRTWNINWPWGYWRPYAVLDNRALFGFPLANGWKVVGELYANGTLNGDYGTNEVEFWTPIWYTHGRMRCEERAEYFFQIRNPQPDPSGYAQALQQRLAKEYQPWATVTIHDDPRMVIHRHTQEQLPLQLFALEDYAAAFDAAATPDLPLGYPVIEPPVAHALDVNFGGLIRLEGYELDAPATLEPGDTMQLTLYWRALQEIDASYKVFTQSYYGDGVMVAQQDSYPVCGSRGTWMWEPGEQVVDVHLLTIEADAPDGLYPLYAGLYIEETLERLSIVDASGQPVADRVHLTDIRIDVE